MSFEEQVWGAFQNRAKYHRSTTCMDMGEHGDWWVIHDKKQGEMVAAILAAHRAAVRRELESLAEHRDNDVLYYNLKKRLAQLNQGPKAGEESDGSNR